MIYSSVLLAKPAMHWKTARG